MSPTPSRAEAAKKVHKLRRDIEFHEKKYYTDNDPQISDAEFDRLMAELKRLEDVFPDLVAPESPTQRVGETPAEGFPSVVHSRPMLSIDNGFTEEEIREFGERIAKLLPSEKIEYAAELKIDGLSISVRYRKGRYLQALTRGDGLRGDDVTANVKTIKSLPLQVEDDRDLEARGEIYLPFQSFRKINQDREEQGESVFANPRNAAAGSVRLLDPKLVAGRGLSTFLYALTINGRELPSQW